MGNESDATMALDTLDLDDLQPMDDEAAAPPPVPTPGGADNDGDELDPARLDDAHLIESLERELAATVEPERAARLRFELGLLCERCGEPDQACEHFLKAHTLQPEHVASIRAARRLLTAAGRANEALPLFDAELPFAPTPERRARLLYQKGLLLERALERVDDALQSYRQGLELAPRDLDLLRATARIERAQAQWDALDRTLEALGNATAKDPRYQALILAERARIADLHGDDPVRTLELYLEATEADPDVPGAAEALKRLGRDQGQWHRIIEALQRDAERSEDPGVRASAQARVAQLCIDHVGDLNRAAAALEAAVAEQPNDRERRWLLVRVYSRAGLPAEQVRALEGLRGLCQSRAERAALAHRMGAICEGQLADPNRAEQLYRQALEEDPSHAPARLGLMGLYQSTGNHGALLELVEQQIEATADPTYRASLHVRAGELNERLQQEPDAAIHHYRRALALDPTQLTALRALDRVLPDLQRFAELVQVYEEVVDHAADDAQAQLYLFRIGALYEDRVGDLAGAIHAYERILERSPEHTGALHALQRVAKAADDPVLLMRTLEQEMALREPSSHWAALGVRIAELYADVLDSPADAIARSREILQYDPEHRQARELLTRLYRSEKRWEDLVHMREAELAQMPDGAARAALAYELGALCDSQLARVEAAIGHYRTALELAPEHRPAFESLMQLLAREHMWKAAVKALEVRAEVVQDPRERAHLAVQRGKLWEGPLGDPEHAQQAYEDALAQVPGFPEALDARSRLLGQRQQYPDLVQALMDDAEVYRDPRLRRESLLRAASVQIHVLQEPDAAEATLRQVLQHEPADLAALRDLEGLWFAAGDRESLSQVYGTEAMAVQDEALRASALRDLAHSHGVEPDVTEEAQSAFERLVAVQPRDIEALEALVRAAEARGDSQRLLEVSSTLATLEQDRGIAAVHRLTVARGLEATASEETLDAYRTALSMEPDSLMAIRGLARAAIALQEPDALREAAEREVSASRSSELAVDLLIHAAAIRRRNGDVEGAARDAEAALSYAPDEPRAEAALSAVLEPRGERKRLADLLARAADRAASGERKAELHVRVAVLRAHTDLNAAIAACERALVADPDHAGALSQLTALLQRAKDWARAADTQARLAEVATDPDARCDAHLALAEIAMDKLNDPDRAGPSIEQVLTVRPDDRRALGLQGQLYARTGKMDEACEIAERLVEVTEEPSERAAALVHAARVMEQCGKQEGAEGALVEALGLEGHAGPAAHAYRARIAAGHGSWDAYVQALTKYLQTATAAGLDTASTVRAIAQVQQREQGANESALETLQAGLGKSPEHPGLNMDYARVLLAMGQHGQALRVCRAQLDRHPQSPALWRVLASVQRATGNEAEALSASAPLLLLDAAEGEELIAIKLRKPRPAAAQPGSLNDEILGALDREGSLSSPALDLVRELSGPLAKLHPPDLSAYGLTRRDRIDSTGQPALYDVFERIANTLSMGTDDVELYVHSQPEMHVTVALTDTPSLLVPRAVLSQRPAAIVFALGAPMFLVSRGLAPVAAMEPARLLTLLVGAVRRQREAFGGELGNEEVVEEASRAVSKAIPWLSRKRVDEAIEKLGELSAYDLKSWMDQVQRCACRIGLLLSDDPVASLQLRLSDTGRALNEDDLSRELLGFWASEAASAYRGGL